MICNPCKAKKHKKCPSKAAQDPSKPSMALSPEGQRIQLSGLCPCHHRARLMTPITVEEAEEKVRAGLRQDCGCGGQIVAGPEVPVGDVGEFVKLWFEDHSYEDLSKHGLLVKAKTQAMRKTDK